MLKSIKSLNISGVNCLPIVEGGKGIGITNGITAGHFAKAGAVGTFSGVNADYLDNNGKLIPLEYKTHTRRERHEELVNYSIQGGISQAKIANDVAGNSGRIHMNVLWEMGGAERVLQGILDGTKGLIHGVTCGAGMPYRLSEIAEKYHVFYYPIVSSMRAFRALWKRSYHKAKDLLGGVVYECPEYPVPLEWKQKLMALKKGDIYLNRFSPTGFYSSAIENSFIRELKEREIRQIDYRTKAEGEFTDSIPFGQRGRVVYIKPADKAKVDEWNKAGFTEGMKTPDETLMFVDKSKSMQIVTDQINCMGCLSQCRFSNWSDKADMRYTTDRKADPRSFCIQKTLQDVRNGIDMDHQLMFSGHAAYRFATDPYYANGFVPTIGQLVERIMQGK